MSNKRGRHAKRGGRTTPKGTRPLHLVRDDWRLPASGPSPAPAPEPELVHMVEEALATGQPLELLAVTSSLLWALHPASPPGRVELPPLDVLVEMWSEISHRSTTALLAAVGEMADDPATRAVAAATVAQRHHPLPAWVAGLAEASVTRVVEVSHVLGDGETFLVDLHIPGSSGLTISVYVDHNVGTFLKDAYVVPEALEPVLRTMADLLEDPDTTVADIDPADARAKVAEALASPLSNGLFDHEDTWPRCRPLVEWVLRLLPEGGTGYVHPTWSRVEQDQLIGAFFASPYGRALRDADRRFLLHHIIEAILDHGDDPLRWSPVTVEVLMVDHLPDDIDLDAELLRQAPDLLRAFIGYAHAERSIPAALTEVTIDAVDRWLPDLLGGIDELDGGWDEPWSYEAVLLDELRREVGSELALHTLDAEPLPDEPFAWEGVPLDVHDRLLEVLGLIDATCEELFDVELRTAARRLVARVVAGDPAVFTRKGRTETAAAALVWIVATPNEAFTRHGVGVKDLMAHLGLRSGTPSQRADTFLRAAGINPHRYPRLSLGEPSLLTSAQRRSIIDRRDRYEATLKEGDGW